MFFDTVVSASFVKKKKKKRRHLNDPLKLDVPIKKNSYNLKS